MTCCATAALKCREARFVFSAMHKLSCCESCCMQKPRAVDHAAGTNMFILLPVSSSTSKWICKGVYWNAHDLHALWKIKSYYVPAYLCLKCKDDC
jgi:hypothetical protein